MYNSIRKENMFTKHELQTFSRKGVQRRICQIFVKFSKLIAEEKPQKLCIFPFFYRLKTNKIRTLEWHEWMNMKKFMKKDNMLTMFVLSKVWYR